MERIIKVFRSHKEQEEEDQRFMRSLTPDQRIQMLVELVNLDVGAEDRHIRFLELLVEHQVEFVVVGGYSLAFHGVVRYTPTIDVLISRSDENSQRILRAIDDSGHSSLGITREDLFEPDLVIQIGMPPNRIDVISGIEAVTFEEAWQTREAGRIAGIPVSVISIRHLRANKRATNRSKDQIDLLELENISPEGTERSENL